MKIYHVTPYAKEILKEGRIRAKGEKSDVMGIGTFDVLGGIEKGASFTASLDIANDFVHDFDFMREMATEIDNRMSISRLFSSEEMCPLLAKYDQRTEASVSCDVWKEMTQIEPTESIFLQEVRQRIFCLTHDMMRTRVDGSNYDSILRNKTKIEQKGRGMAFPEKLLPRQRTFEEFSEKYPQSKKENIQKLVEMDKMKQIEFHCQLPQEIRDDKPPKEMLQNEVMEILNHYLITRRGEIGGSTPAFIHPTVSRFKKFHAEILEACIDMEKMPIDAEELEKQLGIQWKKLDELMNKPYWRMKNQAKFFSRKNINGVGAINPHFEEVVVPPHLVRDIQRYDPKKPLQCHSKMK